MKTTGNSVRSSWALLREWCRRSVSPRRQWRCRRLDTPARVSARQERIVGWDQGTLARSTLLCVGAGGIDGEIVEGLVQKGAGHIHVVDFDTVSPTNLNRQKFGACDLWKNKAMRLARVMSRRGFLGSRLTAHPLAFQQLPLHNLRPDLVICAVDNQLPTTRLAMCRYAHERGLPAVFTGVTPDADGGYVFVQQPGAACWACVLKPELLPAAAAALCPESPASVDILKVLGGLALYAADSLLMRRPRDWNYWYASLSTAGLGGPVRVTPRPACPVCGLGGD